MTAWLTCSLINGRKALMCISCNVHIKLLPSAYLDYQIVFSDISLLRLTYLYCRTVIFNLFKRKKEDNEIWQILFSKWNTYCWSNFFGYFSAVCSFFACDNHRVNHSEPTESEIFSRRILALSAWKTRSPKLLHICEMHSLLRGNHFDVEKTVHIMLYDMNDRNQEKAVNVSSWFSQ